MAWRGCGPRARRSCASGRSRINLSGLALATHNHRRRQDMRFQLRMKGAAVALAAAGALGVANDVAAQSSNEIFVPVLVYRTGPYAPNGAPWADRYVDYLKLVNARDGGVNGIKIAFEECET